MRTNKCNLIKINVLIACLACIFTASIFTNEVSAESITKITTTKRSATDLSGVESVSCRSNEKVVGGGCFCTGYSPDNEGGYLFSCVPAGNSYVGGCYAINPPQTYTPIEVFAVCMKTTPKGKISASSAALVESSVASSESSEVLEIKNDLIKMREEHEKAQSK